MYHPGTRTPPPGITPPYPLHLPTQPCCTSQYRLNELLYRQLPRQLAPSCREVFPSYRDFISALAVRGGVVEACPDQVCVWGGEEGHWGGKQGELGGVWVEGAGEDYVKGGLRVEDFTILLGYSTWRYMLDLHGSCPV